MRVFTRGGYGAKRGRIVITIAAVFRRRGGKIPLSLIPRWYVSADRPHRSRVPRAAPRFFSPSSEFIAKKWTRGMANHRGFLKLPRDGAKFFSTSKESRSARVLEYPLLRAISESPRPQSDEENDRPDAILRDFPRLSRRIGSFLI